MVFILINRTTAARSDWRKANMTREQQKHCATIIKAMKQYRNAGPFLDPVDPVKLGIPDYLKIIQHPMDIGTLERKLDNWKPANPCYKKLRQLTRERDQLVQMRTIAKNQLHAEQSEAEPNKNSVSRVKKQIAFLDKQEQEIKADITALIKQDEPLKQKVELISSIPGVGNLTAVTVLAETNGFELIRSKKQLTSYAGLDVREKQSGTSVKGKPRISKKGNKFLRKSLHLPALAAIRHDQRYKAVFARLVSKHGIKMKAAVAVQRKLLELIYIIFKSGKKYDSAYLQINREQQNVTP